MPNLIRVSQPSAPANRLLNTQVADDEWATSPYFGTVREHTAAFIDRLRAMSTPEPEDALFGSTSDAA